MSAKLRWKRALAAIGFAALCYGAFELGRASSGHFVVSSML
jgi:hypothetical protein